MHPKHRNHEGRSAVELLDAGDTAGAASLVEALADRLHAETARAAFDAAVRWAQKTAPQLDSEHRRAIIEDWRGLTTTERKVVGMLADCFARRHAA